MNGFPSLPPLESDQPGHESRLQPDHPSDETERFGIVGRDADLRFLRHAVDAVISSSSSSGRVVLLSGASGAGKTLMAESTLEYAQTRGFRVVRTSCEPFHEGMSFYPIRELSRQLTSSHGIITELNLAFGAASSQVAIANLAESASADPSDRRGAFIATFANQVFARIILDKTPVALFVDGLELIDPGSADALLCLISRLREGRVLVLGAYQSNLLPPSGSSVHPLRPILTAIRRGNPSFAIVELGPFPEEYLERLVAALLGGPCELPNSFFHRLYEETEGNPLYVRETLRSLSDNRRGPDTAPLRCIDGVWKLVRHADTWEIPRSTDDAIASRFVSLSEFDRSLLERAAVIGKRFSFAMLYELGPDEGETKLIDALERFVKLDFIREVHDADDVFEFSSAKVRDVLYKGIVGVRLRRLHGQVADNMHLLRAEISPDEWDVIVGSHLYAARGYAEAAPYLLNAGERALSMHSATDAAHHLRRAVDAFEKASAPQEEVDHARLQLGRALKDAVEFTSAEAEFRRILASGGNGFAQRWAHSYLGDMSLVQGRIPEAIKWYAKCEKMARDTDDTALLAETASDLAELHMRQAEQQAGLDPVRAAEHQREYLRYLGLEQELVVKLEQPHARARAYRNSAKRARTEGNMELAISLYQQSVDCIGETVDSHQFRIPYAKALRLVGRHDEAIEIVKRVLDWSRQIGARRSEAIARQYLGLILMEQALNRGPSDLVAAEAEMLKALSLHEEVGFEQGRRETEVDLAELASHRGDRAGFILHSTRALSDSSDRQDEEIAQAVLATLRANGERDRAERFWQSITKLGGF